GEGAHAHSGTRVRAIFPENLHHEVRKTVDDLGVVGEFRDSVDHAQHLYDTFYPLEVPQFGLENGELVDPSDAGGPITFIDAEVPAQLADNVLPISFHRSFAREVNDV